MKCLWHLITGEYPPSAGGVADYTLELARALVSAGHVPNVWCRGDANSPINQPDGVMVHRVAGRFGPSGLDRLDRELSRFPGPRTILIQYSPPAFGFKAMNLPFAAWVLGRRLFWGDDVRVMFHEVAFPWVRRPLKHNLLAAANRIMAALLVRACSRAYVSIPGWIPLLRQVGSGRLPITWLPIPSNLPNDPLPEDVSRRRYDLTRGRPKALVIGHFGTYGGLITQCLDPVLRDLLERPVDIRFLLLGAGGDRWKAQLISERPEFSDRIIAPGSLPLPEVAEYLRACDLVLQPYPDGVSSRRTTVMAALANGVPVVTNFGRLSEPIWDDGSVALARDICEFPDLAMELLGSSERRAELGRAGRRLYDERFDMRHTIAALIAP